MYQIKCDDHILYDPRDEELIVQNPKCKLEVNTVGEASFSIFATHPYYGHLQKMRSIFEISQNGEPIFRGRMVEDSKDFHNIKTVDLEGVLGFFNDSIVRPFVFPDDFVETDGYSEAITSGNVVKFFLSWLIDQHNAQVDEFQRFKLGEVTVAANPNIIYRESADYLKTWEVLKTRLFESSLGGYLCIRYEDDGNYIDYLADFELTNIQRITYGENLLDITLESDASETYTAVIPLGARMNEINTATDDESRLTIKEMPDRFIDTENDLAKYGDYVYSQKGVEKYGWIFAPTSETTWEDITTPGNLMSAGLDYLTSTALKLQSTTTIKAVDLHFSDDEVESFRIYRYIAVSSKPHEEESRHKLTRLEIDILNPQNTIITIGETVLSLTDITHDDNQAMSGKVAVIVKQSAEQSSDISEIQMMMAEQSTSIVSTCEAVILDALKSYVETSNFEEFRETVEAQLRIMADEIVMNFTTTTDRITDVDGDLQAKFSELSKYISYSDAGITIGSGDSAITLRLDNEAGIVFSKNGLPFGHWDGVDFHTGNIVVDVNERAQFGAFAFVPRTDGSLSFLKVSG